MMVFCARNWSAMPVVVGLLGACSGGTISGGSPADAGAPHSDSAVDAAIEELSIAVGPDRQVIAGLVVRLDGSQTTGAQSYAWQQVEGDTLAVIDATTATARVQIPANAQAGATYVFRLTVSDGAETQSQDMTVTAQEAAFARFLDSTAVSNDEGIAFNAQGLWVVSEDEVALFGTTGGRLTGYDMPGIAAGANFSNSGTLLLARYETGAVIALDTGTGDVTMVVDSAPSANYPLPDRDGNIYVSTRTGQTILRYDGASGQTTTWLGAGITNPNALAFGPEEDVLYVGGDSAVYRVPILPSGQAGSPELYLDTDSEVDGIVFDDAFNVYVGCPNTRKLYVAPYVAGAATAPSRTFVDVGADFSYFVNPAFGRGGYGETTIYYTNLGGQSVGRIDVGLPALRPPLAP